MDLVHDVSSLGGVVEHVNEVVHLGLEEHGYVHRAEQRDDDDSSAVAGLVVWQVDKWHRSPVSDYYALDFAPTGRTVTHSSCKVDTDVHGPIREVDCQGMLVQKIIWFLFFHVRERVFLPSFPRVGILVAVPWRAE